jgi:hypothetical protein
MPELTELTDEAKGLYNVQTETSSYLIDMDEMQAMRSPNTGAGIHPDHAENRIVYVNKIRGDGEWFPISTIKQCIVGILMFIYQPNAGMRQSTIVCKISQVYFND